MKLFNKQELIISNNALNIMLNYVLVLLGADSINSIVSDTFYDS